MRFKPRIDFRRIYYGIDFGSPGFVIFETKRWAFVHVAGCSTYSQWEGRGYSSCDNLVIDKSRTGKFVSVFNGRISKSRVLSHAETISRLMDRSIDDVNAAIIKAASARWIKTVTL